MRPSEDAECEFANHTRGCTSNDIALFALSTKTQKISSVFEAIPYLRGQISLRRYAKPRLQHLLPQHSLSLSVLGIGSLPMVG